MKAFVKEPKDYEEELQNAIRTFMTQLIHNYKRLNSLGTLPL